METLFIIVHFIVAFFLIGVILIQGGKGADIGAAFGAGGSQTVFGPRGAATLLHKVTIGVAATFLATSIGLAYMSRQNKGSVLDEVPAALEEGLVEPEVPAEQPTTEPSPPVSPK